MAQRDNYQNNRKGNNRDYNNNSSNYNRNQNFTREYREKSSNQSNQQQDQQNRSNNFNNTRNREEGKKEKKEKEGGGILMTATISLVDDVDKRVVVVLRDGKNLYGTMRSFDQFANIVLEDTVERIFVGDKYCEEDRGTYVIRGENVALLGEMDPDHELEVTLKKLHKLPSEELLKLKEELQKKLDAEEAQKRQILRARGLGYDLDD